MKICIKCHGEVFNNLSVLCEACSNSEKICAICLKKTFGDLKKRPSKGFGSI